MSRRIASLALLCCCVSAQQLTFEAASIKPSPTRPPNVINALPPGGPGTSDPGRIHYTWIPLKRLLMNAYDVKDFQISGPDWLASTRFDLEATMPPETTKPQFRAMLQNLLAERFQMTIHHETKDLPIYSLVVAKGGLKMNQKTDNYGFPAIPKQEQPRMMELAMKDRARLVGFQQTTQDLADHLGLLNRPVIDASGLTEKFDFTLTFSLEGLAIAPTGGTGVDIETPPDLFTALQSQLGLKLESKKGPINLIVIDHIEKTPTGN
jgi:uncharacterized protein (TIGR03435 family)